MAKAAKGADDYPVWGSWNARRDWFEAQLKDRSREECILLAARAALRVLPRLRSYVPASERGASSQSERARHLLALLRCNALSLVASLASTSERDRFRAAATPAAAGPDFTAEAVAAYAAAYAAAGPDLTAARPDFAVAAAAAAAATATATATATAATATAAESAYTAAAAAAESAYTAARSAVSAFLTDLERLDGNFTTRRRLALVRLWPDGMPAAISAEWDAFATILRAMGDDFDIWTDWYGGGVWNGKAFPGVLQGTSQRGPSLFGLKRTRALAVWRDIALIPDEFWKNPATVNAEMKRIVAVAREEALGKQKKKPPTIDEIAAVTSPIPFINENGQLDVKPNPATDKPDVDEELVNLPARQIAVIKALLAGLPRNAPGSLREALRGYSEHLLVHGVQPQLGLLGDMHAIAAADFAAPDADQWLTDGVGTAREIFEKNHTLLMSHFPLDKKRDEVLARIEIDESKLDDGAIRQAIKQLDEATKTAAEEGIVSAEFATATAQHGSNLKTGLSIPLDAYVPQADDRISSPSQQAKKRIFVNAGGFAKKASEEIAKVTIAEAAKGPLLAALETLWNLIRLTLGL